jgi:hypothetical protein
LVAVEPLQQRDQILFLEALPRQAVVKELEQLEEDIPAALVLAEPMMKGVVLLAGPEMKVVTVRLRDMQDHQEV